MLLNTCKKRHRHHHSMAKTKYGKETHKLLLLENEEAGPVSFGDNHWCLWVGFVVQLVVLVTFYRDIDDSERINSRKQRFIVMSTG